MAKIDGRHYTTTSHCRGSPFSQPSSAHIQEGIEAKERPCCYGLSLVNPRKGLRLTEMVPTMAPSCARCFVINNEPEELLLLGTLHQYVMED
jgi:hypothetical protein